MPDSLTFLEATTIGGESHSAIVKSAWDFDALAKEYESYFAILRLRPGAARGLESWRDWIEAEHRAWAQLVRRDPFLPEQLLPNNYQGREAWAARQEAFADCSAALVKRIGPSAATIGSPI